MKKWKGRLSDKMKLEASVISDILYAFDQGNFIFIREKSKFCTKCACGNHGLLLSKDPAR